MQTAMRTDPFQLFFEFVNSPVNSSLVRLELGFARTSGTDATAQPREFHAPARQTWQQVTQLSQFHLKLSLSCPSPTGKDIQNELRPVDNAAANFSFDIALLGGRKILIENHYVDIVLMQTLLKLPELARTNQIGRIKLLPFLNHSADDLSAGKSHQRREFVQRFI